MLVAYALENKQVKGENQRTLCHSIDKAVGRTLSKHLDHLPICQEPVKLPHQLEFVNEEDSWTRQSGHWVMQYPCWELV